MTAPAALVVLTDGDAPLFVCVDRASTLEMCEICLMSSHAWRRRPMRYLKASHGCVGSRQSQRHVLLLRLCAMTGMAPFMDL